MERQRESKFHKHPNTRQSSRSTQATMFHSLLLLLLTMATVMTRGHAQDDEVVVASNPDDDDGGSGGGRCELVQVPMCKGLISYNATKLPNKFGHRTQAEVYWALQPWWPFIDAGCSDNLRDFLCGLYLPRCVGDDREPEYPCKETCSKAKVRCKKQMRIQRMRWSREFKCRKLQPKSSKTCIKPQRERKKAKQREYVLCVHNKLPQCHGVPFTQGSLPNMFLQSDLSEIEREMRQFQPLLDSGCSRKLSFFMCGVYMPFCVPGMQVEERSMDSNEILISSQPDVPFVVPCRELCQEVYDQCSGEYQQRTGGLPWPGKFHCHRFPSYIDRYEDIDNTILTDSDNSTDSSNGKASRRGATIPCTMPPFNYDGN